MSAHTPEPWVIAEGITHIWIRDNDGGDTVFALHREDDRDAEANARRIVACVNACAGIDDPAQYIAVARGLADDAEVILDLNEAMENALRECLAVLHPGVVGLIGNYHGDAASAEAARAVNNAKAAIVKMETAACLT